MKRLLFLAAVVMMAALAQAQTITQEVISERVIALTLFRPPVKTDTTISKVEGELRYNPTTKKMYYVSKTGLIYNFHRLITDAEFDALVAVVAQKVSEVRLVQDSIIENLKDGVVTRRDTIPLLKYVRTIAGGPSFDKFTTGNKDSLVLQGDTPTPGNDRYWGTNSAGIRGFYPFPTGGGGGDSSTHLTVVEQINRVGINSSSGDDDVIEAATEFLAGVMSASDKVRLNKTLTGLRLKGDSLFMVRDGVEEFAFIYRPGGVGVIDTTNTGGPFTEMFTSKVIGQNVVSVYAHPYTLEVIYSGVPTLNEVLADTTIGKLTFGTAVDPGQSIRVLYSGTATGVAGGGGDTGPTLWGTIEGNMADQADLDSALATKEPTITTLPVIKGGTGQSFFQTNRLLLTHPTDFFGSLQAMPSGTAGQALISGGQFAPAYWGTVAANTLYTSDGTLPAARIINTAGFPVTWNNMASAFTLSRTSGGAANPVMVIDNYSTNATAVGLRIISSNGPAAYYLSSGLNAPATRIVKEAYSGDSAATVLELIGGGAGDQANVGFGTKINWKATPVVGGVGGGFEYDQSWITSTWTDPERDTRKSKLSLYTTHNALMYEGLSVYNEGRVRLPRYGTNLFGGTATYYLGVDAQGNIVETAGGAGGGAGLTASQGITRNIDDFRWGGSLTAPVNIAAAGNAISFSGSSGSQIFSVSNSSATAASRAIWGEANAGFGIEAGSLLGVGANFYSNANATNSIQTVAKLTRRTDGGNGANGIGARLGVDLETSTGVTASAGGLSYSWTDATNASRTSAMILTTVQAGVESNVLNVYGNGTAQIPFYGLGNKLAAGVYMLGVDASGNIVEMAPYIAGDMIDAQELANGKIQVDRNALPKDSISLDRKVKDSVWVTSFFEDGTNISAFGFVDKSLYSMDGSLDEDRVFAAGVNTLKMTGAPLPGDNVLLIEGTSTDANTTALRVTATSGGAINGTSTGNTGVSGTSTSGQGVRGTSSSNAGVEAISSSGNAVKATSTTGMAGSFTVNPSTTNNAAVVAEFYRSSSGIVANGISAAIDLKTETSTASSTYTAARLEGVMSDVNTATRSGKFAVSVLNNTVLENKFEIDALGAMKAAGYGLGTKTSTLAYALGVDAGGNIIEFTPNTGGAGGGTLQEVLDAGSTLTSSETINTGTFTLNMATTAAAGAAGLSVSNSANGAGINTFSNAGNALTASSNTVAAIVATTSANTAPLVSANTHSATNNDIKRVATFLAQGPATGAAGFGTNMQFGATNSAGGVMATGEIITRYTDATATNEQTAMDFRIRRNGAVTDAMSLLPTGQMRAHRYGTGLFTGTAVNSLGVDASGNIVETSAGGGVAIRESKQWDIFVDFTSSFQGGELAHNASGTGAAASITLGLVDSIMGVSRLQSGTALGNTATLQTSEVMTNYSSRSYILEMQNCRLATLNTASDSSMIIVGFQNLLFNNGAPNHGAYFQYSITSNAWQCITEAGDSRTITTTANTVTANADYQMRIEMSNTLVKFFINGTEVASHTTTIPTGNAQPFGAGVSLKKKTAGVNQVFYIDKYKYIKNQ